MDFDQLDIDDIKDTSHTTTDSRAEITMPVTEDEVATCLEYDPKEHFHGEKADLPEKQRYDCGASLIQSVSSFENEEVEPGSFEQPSEMVLSESSRSIPDNFMQLIESSEYVFNGFEELLKESAILLGGIEKLIRNSKASLRECSSESSHKVTLQSKVDEEEFISFGESSCNLSPVISLTTLQRATDLEQERIKQLQDQIQTMNDSVRSPDVFTKEYQKLNDELNVECDKLDVCTNEELSTNQIARFDIEFATTITTHDSFEPTPLPALEEVAFAVGRYQTVDHTSPKYDRWSTPYEDQLEDSLNRSRLPAAGALNRFPFLAASPYDVLESIWESEED